MRHLIEKCAKVIVKCSMKDCGKSMPREEIPKHLFEECKHFQLKCNFCGLDGEEVADHRCSEILKRKNASLQV